MKSLRSTGCGGAPFGRLSLRRPDQKAKQVCSRRDLSRGQRPRKHGFRRQKAVYTQGKAQYVGKGEELDIGQEGRGEYIFLSMKVMPTITNYLPCIYISIIYHLFSY